MRDYFLAATLLMSISAWAAEQDLVPPKNWSVDAAPPALVFRPDNLRSGEDLRVEVHNPQPAQGDLAEWLAKQIRVLQFDSALVGNCRIKAHDEREASCMTPSSEGDQYFYALRTDAGEYRFLHLVMAPRTLAVSRYLFSLKNVLDVARAGRGRVRETAASVAATPVANADLATAANGTRARTEPAVVPAGAQIDFTPPIAGLYLHLEYIAGVGGGIYPSYEPYVLLKDGSITDDLGYYPKSTQDMENWRRRKPRAWGRWTESGGRLSIRWDVPARKPETWDKWFVARPADDGMRLSGHYGSIGGGGNTALGGDVMIAAWKSFRFSPDGRVESGGGAGGYNGGGGTGVSVATSSRRAPQQGRYTLNGYRLTIEFGDGRRESMWFYCYPPSPKKAGANSKDSSVIGIADSVFTLKD